MTELQRAMLDRLIAPWRLTLTCWGSALRTAESLERRGLLAPVPVAAHQKYAAERVRAFQLTAAGEEATEWR